MEEYVVQLSTFCMGQENVTGILWLFGSFPFTRLHSPHVNWPTHYSTTSLQTQDQKHCLDLWEWGEGGEVSWLHHCLPS